MDQIDRIRQIRSGMIMTPALAFWGHLASSLKVVETDTLPGGAPNPTAATDGVSLLFNRDYVSALPDAKLRGLLAHEISHCTYSHFNRRGNRNPRLYNMATDYAINLDLIAAGFDLPDGALLDSRFEGMTAEAIYVALAKEQADGQAEAGAGEGTGEDPGMCGGIIDAPGAGDPSEAGKLPVGDRWEINTRQAIGVAKANNGGELPGCLARLADGLNAPAFDWRAELRTLANSLSSVQYSFARPNKKYVAAGIYLPGRIPDAIKNLIYVVDVSGSVQASALKAAASEGQGILDSGAVETITVIYTDTEVRKVERFESGDEFRVESEGGGGTSFTAVMEHIAEHETDAAAVVFITDMEVYGDRWGEDPGIPVMWLDTTCRCLPGPSYGLVVPMDLAA